jgi:hypothetical protein
VRAAVAAVAAAVAAAAVGLVVLQHPSSSMQASSWAFPSCPLLLWVSSLQQQPL